MGATYAPSLAFQGRKLVGSNTEGVQPVKRMPKPTTQGNGEDIEFGGAASACEVVLPG